MVRKVEASKVWNERNMMGVADWKGRNRINIGFYYCLMCRISFSSFVTVVTVRVWLGLVCCFNALIFVRRFQIPFFLFFKRTQSCPGLLSNRLFVGKKSENLSPCLWTSGSFCPSSFWPFPSPCWLPLYPPSLLSHFSFILLGAEETAPLVYL